VEAAVELLEGSDSKIIDVAYAVGYEDPSHFSRAFRRLKGTSPREFRVSGAA
jgi:AraC-like DNA-binding protein